MSKCGYCESESLGTCEHCGKDGCVKHSRHCSVCDKAHLCLVCSDGDFVFCGTCGPDWCIPCIEKIGEEHERRNPGFNNEKDYPPCQRCGGELSLA